MTPAIQTVYVDLETGEIRAATTGEAEPDIDLILLTGGRLNFAFMTGGVIEELEASSTGTLVIKAANDTDGDRLFEDTEWTKSGTGTDARYLFTGLVDSADLRTALVGKKSDLFDLQIKWNQPSDAQDSASRITPCTIHNNIVRSGDTGAIITDDVDLVINDDGTAFEGFVNGTSVGFLHLHTTAP